MTDEIKTDAPKEEIKTIPKKETLIEEANKAAERIEKANADLRLLLGERESQVARELLSGRAVGGESIPKVESPVEYKNRILRGNK